MEKIFEQVAKELNLKLSQIVNTMELLDGGATVPFISRYRKEVTENLDEIQIGNILEKVTYLRNLEKRKEEILRLIEEQGKLTEEIKADIEQAQILQKVEDIYFPFRKKRKTKADKAIDNGLEPLADYILIGETTEAINKKAENFLNDDVPSVAEAVEGAMLIIAQRISETPVYREQIREIMLTKGIINTKESKKAHELDPKKVYRDYYDYSEQISKTVSHRVLAINRGEKDGVLSVTITFEEPVRTRIENIILKDFKNTRLKEFYINIVKDALDRLILPSIEREVRNILTEKAESESIEVFKENLKNLLMQPPLNEKTILALDPGYRTGCKVAIIDKNGFYQKNDVFFLVDKMHSARQLDEAESRIVDYVNRYGVDIIVMGNGTASRETESFVANVIKKHKLDTKYLITNEAGASVYSASKIAAEEFPDLDVTVRGAISIGRRVQDPLAELVKIDPKSIGVGMYQHDVNQGRLDESLDAVITYVVNSVGANLNTASWALLSHISGIRKNVAKNIVDYRKENGNFKDRKQLMKVKGIGEKAYEQMAGFLVIVDGDNVLDNTIIHPESYHIAEELLKEAGLSVKEYGEDLDDARKKLKGFDFKEFAKKHDYGAETVKDIYEALIRDRRDPRDNFEKPLLKSDILEMKDLKPGMEIEGTVRNVVKFGAFIDIGLKNDALLHISEISDKFIKDPSEVLSVGQIIKVRIKDIDKERERVALTKKEK
ncbi:Tex family protein [Fusobacterium sp.]|uniref:Tex family protein n=1 Tax=Fusobacterium sp. TaxID=68766 RepID=UPI00396C8443